MECPATTARTVFAVSISFQSYAFAYRYNIQNNRNNIITTHQQKARTKHVSADTLSPPPYINAPLKQRLRTRYER